MCPSPLTTCTAPGAGQSIDVCLSAKKVRAETHFAGTYGVCRPTQGDTNAQGVNFQAEARMRRGADAQQKACEHVREEIVELTCLDWAFEVRKNLSLTLLYVERRDFAYPPSAAIF